MKRELLCLSIASVLIVGCSSMNDSDEDYRTPRDRDTRDTSGHGESGRAVPRAAKVITERYGEIRFTPDADGTVYLYDLRDEKVIDSREVRKGREYVSNPKAEKIWVADERVAEPDMDEEHQYRLYFLNPRDTDSRDDRPRDRDDREDRPRDRDDRVNDDSTGPRRGVPRGATVVREGRDQDISWLATDDGTLYLTGRDGVAVIQRFSIKKGQRLTVSVDHDIATLDGKEVMRRDLDDDETYKLLFVSQ